MGMRWILAAGACLALAMFTLPPVRSLNVGAPAEAPASVAVGAEAVSEEGGSAECDDDARPAPWTSRSAT